MRYECTSWLPSRCSTAARSNPCTSRYCSSSDCSSVHRPHAAVIRSLPFHPSGAESASASAENMKRDHGERRRARRAGEGCLCGLRFGGHRKRGERGIWREGAGRGRRERCLRGRKGREWGRGRMRRRGSSSSLWFAIKGILGTATCETSLNILNST